ncbi:unnamed protein product [Gordionus sp. m RMFG-2023]|uniref:receptor-type tyrosine-protein phosphatase S-like n=1 Tax=Gordionus sp. m RMFG-2023 TaxID=3053472 RepID=UPI0030DEEF47
MDSNIEEDNPLFKGVLVLFAIVAILIIVLWIAFVRYLRLNQKKELHKEEIAEIRSEILMKNGKVYNTLSPAGNPLKQKNEPFIKFKPESKYKNIDKKAGSPLSPNKMVTGGEISRYKNDEGLTQSRKNMGDDPYSKFVSSMFKNELSKESGNVSGDINRKHSFFIPPLYSNDRKYSNLIYPYSPINELKYKFYFGAGGNREKKVEPIAVSELFDYINTMKIDPESFKAEHALLPEGHTKPCEIGAKPRNKFRNRYANILAYDEGRVVLQITQRNPDGYINANYIDSYMHPKSYIATQGPLRDYIDEFWEMIWQENSLKIIMLTRIFENKVEKCDRYWPTFEETYGKIKIKVLKASRTANYVIFDLELYNKVELKKRIVRLYWFLSWPDHGVPEKTTEFLSFYNFVKSYDPPYSGPSIIHCSAGVGRTGTFIALDSMIEMGRDKGEIDLFNYLMKMRNQRCNMVQSPEQYEFLYDSILESLVSGGTFISCEDNQYEYFNKICSVNATNGKTLLEDQWQVLGEMAPPITFDPYRLINTGRKKENVGKNRENKVIPKESRRTVFKIVGGYKNATDYINATFVNGYDQRDQFIVTQWPIGDTKIDFWKLVWEYDIRTIVVLVRHREPKEKKDDKFSSVIDSYWPIKPNEVLYFGMFFVELINTSMVLNEDFGKMMVIRTFKIGNMLENGVGDNKSFDYKSYKKFDVKNYKNVKIVKQFQILSWKNREIKPQSTLIIQEVIERSNLWQRVISDEEESKSLDSRPILVQDLDGYSKSGLYIACTHLYEQIRVEDGLNVYLAVKTIRSDRPEFVNSFEQYQFLYKFSWQQILLIKFQEQHRTPSLPYASIEMFDDKYMAGKYSSSKLGFKPDIIRDPNAIKTIDDLTEAINLRYDNY